MVQVLQFMDKTMADDKDANSLQLRLQLKVQLEDLIEEMLAAIQGLSHSPVNLVHIDYHHQGVRWLRSNSVDKAKYCFSKAIKIAPSTPILYVDLALVFAEAKQYHRSEAALEKAHALLVGNPHDNRFLIEKISYLMSNVQRLTDLS